MTDDSETAATSTSTTDTPVELEDRRAFDDALTGLIAMAEANGVEIEGGYQFDGDGSGSDYGIEIYRVASRDD